MGNDGSEVSLLIDPQDVQRVVVDVELIIDPQLRMELPSSLVAGGIPRPSKMGLLVANSSPIPPGCPR